MRFTISAFLIATALASAQDRYGGLPSIRQEATGWFRLGVHRGRQILITPEGHGYLALGVNHLSMLGPGPRDTAALTARLRAWGMTSAGYGAPKELESTLPFFAPLAVAPVEKHRSETRPDSPNSYSFPDVFDPAWKKDVENRIAKLCRQYRDNRYLIGYLWTDTPTWDLIKTRGLRGTEWVSAIRALPPGAPGRQRYSEFLAGRYKDRLPELNTIYGIKLASLDDLASTDLRGIAVGRHVVQEDDQEFLGWIAREYYAAAGSAQRKHDPNHLVFGDRYLAGDAPDNVLAAALPWIDAVAVQPGDRYSALYPPSTRFPAEEMDRLHTLTHKPVFICDHAISYPEPGGERTIFEQEKDAQSAAAASLEFLHQAARRKYIIGYLRCQYIDRPAGFGRGLRQGLVDATERPRTQLVNAYTEGFREWVKQVVSGR